ncbi:P12 family lipoprotein [Borreliella bavariensis]|uniref:P12 family lipoprotein n=1 Tax=Borreliella bavariensis TaxID=664662 RepID=UPI001C0037BC|nr:P12 family lipoprotein [Borreliella bavariensis]
MIKNLFLYTSLMVGLMSCNLDSKLSDHKGQKNNNDVKEVSNSVQKDVFNNLYSNQEEFNKNFGEQKYDNLIVTLKQEFPSETLNSNKAGIPSIEHAQKKEIKKEDLIPFTNEEKKANETIKNIENVLKGSGFSKLIEDVCMLKDEYVLIKHDLYDVMEKIQNKKTSLVENFKNNRNKIGELAKLQNQLKIENIELDNLIYKIDIAENEIRSADSFFGDAQKKLKESIIKRLESKKNTSYALKLSRLALNTAENSLRQLESFSYKINEALARKQEIKELIENAKTIFSNFNR